MTQRIDTVIVGGGQAGLATSYCLRQQGRPHIVLERAAQPGSAWCDRWDSFTLVTPNWTIRLPGAEYQTGDPNGFMPRDEILGYFRQYVERFNLPIQYGVRVTAVELLPDGKGYRVTTDGDLYEAMNVVVATGSFQQPKIPAFNPDFPSLVTQLHSGQYRNPQGLPPGAALVIGSAQSGCQIAEELYKSGRKVYLCVGSAGRAPRRYRGKDTFDWLNRCGFLDQTVDRLPSPKAKFGANPQVSGQGGGHSLNLHQFARDGVTLLGRLRGVRDGKAHLAPDLKENLAGVDRFEVELLKMIDGYIETNGPDAPKEEVPRLQDGYRSEDILELDLRSAGISTVIWAMGYTFDFGLVKLPVVDGDGYPMQQRGVAAYSGLYFVGLNWLHKRKSALLIGVGEDAAYVASHIAARHG
ncbi:MAG TPA: NAD(P)-binding domain-containing protein [Anaerolineae bacterium]